MKSDKAEDIPDNPIKIQIKVLHYVRLIAAFFMKQYLKWYYGESEKIPAIKDDLLRKPAVEIARQIREKEITSVQVVETFIRRIKDVNPALNCFVENRFEMALKEAKEADDLIRSGSITKQQLEQEKPFLGVPFTTKDCIAVKGLHHTSGVVLRKDIVASKDAEAIGLLKDHGAIIIGTTNIPELCMWWETHNHIYGIAKNPYNTTRTVGGSSGGEGSLQAAAGSAFGIGSDIGGSIRIPSFFNGIFGHKPTMKIVSSDGQYPAPAGPIHEELLSLGPMVRHAVDLKPILKIIAGDNKKKLNLDEPVDIKKVKLYYQTSNNAPVVDSVDPEIISAMNKVLEHFKLKHNISAQRQNNKLLRKTIPLWLSLMKNDKDSFAKMIIGKDGVLAVLIELVKSSIGLSKNTFIGLITALLDYGGVEYEGEKYKKNLKRRNNLVKEFQEMLGEDGVFLYPTHPTTAPYHHEPLLRPFNFSYTCLINCFGFPATNIPLGLSREGLPVGLQVIANYNNDRLCLAVAEELDKVFGGWVEPQKE